MRTDDEDAPSAPFDPADASDPAAAPAPDTPVEPEAPGDAEALEAERRRSRRLPLQLGAVFLAVLLVLVGFLAYSALQSARSASGATNDSLGSGPPSNYVLPGFTQVVANGTSWTLAPGHYVALWFSLDEQEELVGELKALSGFDAYLFTQSEFDGFVPSNASTGTTPLSAHALAADCVWSSLNVTSVDPLYVDLVDPLPYDLVLANLASAGPVQVHVTQDVLLEPDD